MRFFGLTVDLNCLNLLRWEAEGVVIAVIGASSRLSGIAGASRPEVLSGIDLMSDWGDRRVLDTAGMGEDEKRIRTRMKVETHP
jgi:hypothetical protein